MKNNEHEYRLLKNMEWQYLTIYQIIELDEAKLTNFNPDTTTQYVGKKDSEGVKIFEGDYLLLEDGSIQQVVFQPSLPGWAMKFSIGATTSIPDNCRVVGNIFTTPEVTTIFKLQNK